MMHQKGFIVLRSILLVIACILSAPALSQQADAETRTDDGAKPSAGLIWSVTPYIWAVDTRVDLTVDDSPVGGGKVTFNDLLDTLDTAFQVVVETGAEGGNWSAFVDFTYMDASDGNTVNVDGTDVRVDTDSTQIFADLAVAWWPQGIGDGYSVYGGIRHTDLDDDYDLSDAASGTPIDSVDNSRSFTDALIGGRYMHDFNDRWSLLTRADFSFGDSEGIWQLQAMARYAVGGKQQHGIIAGYRYKEAELEDDGVNEDYEYKGPAVAFNFRF